MILSVVCISMQAMEDGTIAYVLNNSEKKKLSFCQK